MDLRISAVPRCPGCGSADRWVHSEESRYYCQCGDLRGRANGALLVDWRLQGADEPAMCPRGHGAMYTESGDGQPFHLCPVCGYVGYENGGPIRTQERADQEACEARRKAVEAAISMVGYMRPFQAEIEQWIAQGERRGSGLAIFGGGSEVSNPTRDRAMRLVSDPRVALIGTRCRQIDGVYRASLDPLLQQFASLMYFSQRPEPSMDRVCLSMHGISRRTYYRFREYVLDAFAEGLPGGWTSPQDWWGVSPTEAFSERQARETVAQMAQESVVS